LLPGLFLCRVYSRHSRPKIKGGQDRNHEGSVKAARLKLYLMTGELAVAFEPSVNGKRLSTSRLDADQTAPNITHVLISGWRLWRWGRGKSGVRKEWGAAFALLP